MLYSSNTRRTVRALFVDLIVRRRMVRLADNTIPERSAAQHADFALSSAMSFAAARARQNLRSFILRDHSLELQEQFILGRRTARRAHKQGLDAGTRELLDQENLVRVSSAQAVGRVDQDRLDQPLRREITHPLEARTD